MSGSAESPKRTPLYPVHLKYNAKIIDFHGWEMPVYYTGIRDEHLTVRSKAGIFDVSHMGYVSVSGKNALDAVQKVFTADATKMKNGVVSYGLLCNEKGGIVDDVTLFKIGEESYFFCVNASNVEKDYEWIKKNSGDIAETKNESTEKGIIALQGPMADEILAKVAEDADLKSLRFFHFTEGKIGNDNVIISRTGYTGEKGFEFFFQRNRAETIWNLLMEAGKEYGLKPAGLGARDTLRLEMKYTLYGNDIDDSITPLEACLERYVDFDKGFFVGRDALLKQKEEGIPRRLVGFKMIDAGIPRQGYEIIADGNIIGKVTSGNKSFSTGDSIGMALVKTEYSSIGTSFFVSIRGKNLKAEVVKTPFYKK
ncbi:MAG: glycine cleavage system aminomethyltransferase GcvT [Candidatus Schekmanbacteria bacterium]|nr:MAG: glycine cleavage system aminomethyltransferase GcvT [Candidatus Schekmanbacteria bacterium]